MTTLILLAGLASIPGAGVPNATNQMVGINVVLRVAPTPEILNQLSQYGNVLDVIPEINALTLYAKKTNLQAIQGLPIVQDANVDEECKLASNPPPLPLPDLSNGSNQWTLDAINVTDVGLGRTVPYDGQGVYIAVLDSGLAHNWRAYFPEQRIAAQFARAFGGGGGSKGTISSQPDKWERDTNGHGTTVTSVILGFAYSGTETGIPSYFNGVAPKANVIPVKLQGLINNSSNGGWESQIARAIVYVTNLKVSGELGGAPLVINLSSGLHQPLPLERAAINYAIANGVIVISVAGNEGDEGMRNPGAYPEVISVASVGNAGEFPPDDPTAIAWILRDVAENSPASLFIAPDSSRELPGQELDVAASGWMVPVPFTVNGQVDYTFITGTSQATPHVAGVAALMLQKNPNLTQAQVESILKSTAMPLPPDCRSTVFPNAGPGNQVTFDDHENVTFFTATVCWGANATGAGLVQADAALAATP